MSKPSFGLNIVNHAVIRKVGAEHRLQRTAPCWKTTSSRRTSSPDRAFHRARQSPPIPREPQQSHPANATSGVGRQSCSKGKGSSETPANSCAQTTTSKRLNSPACRTGNSSLPKTKTHRVWFLAPVRRGGLSASLKDFQPANVPAVGYRSVFSRIQRFVSSLMNNR